MKGDELDEEEFDYELNDEAEVYEEDYDIEDYEDDEDDEDEDEEDEE